MKTEDLNNLKIEDLEEVTEGYFPEGEDMIIVGNNSGCRYIKPVFFIKSDFRNGIISVKDFIYSSTAYKVYKIPQPKMRDMNSLEVMEYLHKLQLWVDGVDQSFSIPEEIVCFFADGGVLVQNFNNMGWEMLFLKFDDGINKDMNFGILKRGKITEFKLPQVEV